MPTWKDRYEARQERYRQEARERDEASVREMDQMPEDRCGLCYFIGDYDIVKIGFSRDVHRRHANLRSNAGMVRLSLLATARGGRSREAHYHRRFAAHRKFGEWFARVPEIEAEIARLNEGTPA